MTSLGSTRWTDSNPNITLTFEYDKRRSGADMEYCAKVTVSTVTGSSYFGYPITLKLSIGGTERVTRTLKNASPSQWSSAITYTSPWYKVANKTTGTTPISFNVYSGQGSSRSATYSYNMAVDPAASIISAPNGTLGTTLAISLGIYNANFTHTVTYSCGTASGVIISGSKLGAFSWSTAQGNTVALASQNPRGQSVQVTFTVATYSGSTPIGTNSKTVTMAIPFVDATRPSVKISTADAAGYLDTYGGYVQGYSKLRITATPTLAYGSPIDRYVIMFEGNTYNTNPVTIGAIHGKGTLPVTARVADARGYYSETASVDIKVLEYAKPSVKLNAYRCTENGVANPEGAYMKIVVASSISSLNNKNTASYKVVYSGGTLTGSGTSFMSDVLPCDVATTHTIEVTITDKLSYTKVSTVIPIAFTLLDFYNTGKGIAFGKVGTRDGFDCAMPAYFTGGVNVSGKSLLDLIYPVGSIYMSMNNVSPATFFGGEWAPIQNRFLIGAGSTYNVGAMGGYATHVLTLDELPAHRHDRVTYAGNGGWFIGDNTGLGSTQTGENVKSYNGTGITSTTTSASLWATNTVGGGKAHNNMPPYIAVYMWQRTK